MVDALQDATVSSRGGLFTNEDALTLATSFPGSAIRMLNMEISQFGGYRRVSGYAPYDASYPSVIGLGPVIGLFILAGVPYAARRNDGDFTGTLGNNPFSIANGTNEITVTHTAHGLAVNDRVIFSGSTAIGNITPNDLEMSVASIVDANTYTVQFSTTATSTTTGGGASVGFKYLDVTNTLGTNPFSVTSGSSTVTVTHNNHGLSIGNFVTFTGSATVGGININSVEMQVTTTTTNTYTIEFTSAATATATGGGGAVSARYSQYYTIWKYNTGGWTRVHSFRSSIGVSKVRHSFNTLQSEESVILTDGVNLPCKITGNTFSTHVAGVSPKNPQGAKVSTFFDNRVFYAGFPVGATAGGPSFILHADAGDDDTFAGTSNVLDMGFPVVGIAQFRDSLFVFGENEIKKVIPDPTLTFAVQDVTSNVGCIATDSIMELGGDVLFLASDGIRPIQGTARIGDIELETISKPIQQILQALPSTHDLDNMSSVVIRNKSQFRYFFPSTATAAADTEGLIGGLRFADRRVGWEFGQLLGIRAFVSTSGLINKVETVLHGDANGEIFKQETGSTFNGGDVTSVYATPFLYFDSTERRKIYQHISLFTRPEGTATINLGIAYDWDDPNVPDPSTYALTTAGALARYTTTGSTYDSTFTFDGSSSPILESNIQGSGRAISLVITSTGTQAPYSISGFSITYQNAGYR